MCVDFRKINELQPKTQRVDKQTDTQGNLSLIPLPKIDEMYANLRGAKIFTTLVLRSGLLSHHFGQRNPKQKLHFVMPFGKYEFNAVPFGLGACTGVLSTINIYCFTGLQWLCDGLLR